MYKFLFYKMFRYAKAEEESVYIAFGFSLLVSIFELLHLVILSSLFEDVFGVKLKPSNFLDQYFGWLFVIVGFTLNYFIFIKTKWIYRINQHYQAKNLKVWKGNLLFFGYVIFLFVIMFIQTWYYQKHKG